MPPAPAEATPDTRARTQDMLLALAVLGFTAVVFWPPIRWLASQAFAREQLKQSFILVVLAGLWIAFEKRRTLRLRLEFSHIVIAWLLAAYALAGGAILLKTPLLILAGLVAVVGGVVNYLFGAQAFRRTLPLLSVFAVLILCVLLFPVLDWPLRQMAGVESARFLKSIGLAS